MSVSASKRFKRLSAIIQIRGHPPSSHAKFLNLHVPPHPHLSGLRSNRQGTAHRTSISAPSPGSHPVNSTPLLASPNSQPSSHPPPPTHACCVLRMAHNETGSASLAAANELSLVNESSHSLNESSRQSQLPTVCC